MEEKSQLRSRINALRREALAGVKDSCDGLWQKVEVLDGFRNAGTILMYAALSDEIPTSRVIERWSRMGKRIALPVVCGEELILKIYDPLRLQTGYKGILEPSDGCETIDPDKIDLAVVPGVAFDHDGYRLGRGKGFYDRLLPKLKCPAVAVALPCQIVDSLPVEAWDRPVDKLIF